MSLPICSNCGSKPDDEAERTAEDSDIVTLTDSESENSTDVEDSDLEEKSGDEDDAEETNTEEIKPKDEDVRTNDSEERSDLEKNVKSDKEESDKAADKEEETDENENKDENKLPKELQEYLKNRGGKGDADSKVSEDVEKSIVPVAANLEVTESHDKDDASDNESHDSRYHGRRHGIGYRHRHSGFLHRDASSPDRDDRNDGRGIRGRHYNDHDDRDSRIHYRQDDSNDDDRESRRHHYSRDDTNERVGRRHYHYNQEHSTDRYSEGREYHHRRQHYYGHDRDGTRHYRPADSNDLDEHDRRYNHRYHRVRNGTDRDENRHSHRYHRRHGHRRYGSRSESHRRRKHLYSEVVMPTGDKHRIWIPQAEKQGWKCGDKSELITLRPTGYKRYKREYNMIATEMEKTRRVHYSGSFSGYDIVKIEKIINPCLWKQYRQRRKEVQMENTVANEKMLFHGSPFWQDLIHRGFDERHSKTSGMFGAGLYFAENSSKSNQYVFGLATGNLCPGHKASNCMLCERVLILCRVILGNVKEYTSGHHLAHPPVGHHSVQGTPSTHGLLFSENIVYRGEQVYPEFLITYKLKP